MTAELSMEAEPRPSLVSTLLGPYRVLSGNRDLDLLFGGQVVSSFGDWLYITALVVLAYNLTHSATLVALLTFVRLLPYALFLPFSGALADRFNPKALMIGADLGRCVCMLALLDVTSRGTLALAFPLVFIATCLFSLFRPALNATLPAVVGDETKLVQANTIRSQVDGLAFVVGPSLTGILILLGQTRIAFAINAVTYLVSAATLLLVRVPPRPQETRPSEGSWLAETLAGYRFLFRENEGVLAAATLSVAAPCVLGGAIWTLIVVLAVQTFQMGSQGAGFLNTAYGAGGLIGGFLVGLVVSKFRVARGFVVAVGASAICATLFGLCPAGILPFVLLALVGLTDVFVEVFGTTIIQTATPRELLGRVFGAFESTYILAMLAGTLVSGPLIAAFGPRPVAVGMGLLSVVVVALFLPRLLKLESALGVRIFLRQVPVLTTLSRAVVDDLALRVQLERAPAATAIVRQGEPGDKLYIVKQGEVEVSARNAEGQNLALATLSPMDYFGEIALLRDVPRTATVQARGPVELYSLSRADFQELLARSEQLRSAMTGTGDTRYLDTQSRLLMRL